MSTWHPGFVHHCSKCKRGLVMVRVREPLWEIVSILHWCKTLCLGLPYKVGNPMRVLSAGIATALSGSPHLLFLPTAARLHSFSPCAMVVPIDSTTVRKSPLQKDHAWVHESRVTRFCTVALNTCGPSLWTCFKQPAVLPAVRGITVHDV